MGKDFKAPSRTISTEPWKSLPLGQSLPLETTASHSTPDLKDAWGLPAPSPDVQRYPDDLKLGNWMFDRAHELFAAANAQKSWSFREGKQQFAGHLLGTCRNGKRSEDV